MASKLEKIVWELVGGIVNSLGYEVADVEFARGNEGNFLRIYIYSEKGISIDDCVEVHRAVENVIDDKAGIEGSYILEISSPGYDRKFKYPEDYKRYMGEMVDVKLYKAIDGKKTFEGILKAYEPGKITVEVNGEANEFVENYVASVKRKFVI